jgi:hypothetical protein
MTDQAPARICPESASEAGSFVNGVTLAVDGAHHAALA